MEQQVTVDTSKFAPKSNKNAIHVYISNEIDIHIFIWDIEELSPPRLFEQTKSQISIVAFVNALGYHFRDLLILT